MATKKKTKKDTKDATKKASSKVSISKKKRKYTKKKKSEQTKSKKWSWSDFIYKKEADYDLLSRSALVRVDDPEYSADDFGKDKKVKGRKFKGATTKKGQAHGPANATGMGVGAGTAMGTSPGGPAVIGPTDGGYGVGGYGLQAYGEALERMAKKFSEFMDSVAEEDQALIDTISSGYEAVFESVGENAKAIMMAFQPSFRHLINFNIDDLVKEINRYNGELMCLYMGESLGFEDLDVIIDWYKYIGIKESKIEKMIFVEKEASYINKKQFTIKYNDNSVDKKEKQKIDDLKDKLKKSTKGLKGKEKSLVNKLINISNEPEADDSINLSKYKEELKALIANNSKSKVIETLSEEELELCKELLHMDDNLNYVYYDKKTKTLKDFESMIEDWNEVGVFGLCEPFMLAEVLYALGKSDKLYDIDPRFMYML
jgi:hypothetical protein